MIVSYYGDLSPLLMPLLMFVISTLLCPPASEGEASALQPPQFTVQSLFRRLLPGVQNLPDGHSQGPSRQALREPGQGSGGKGQPTQGVQGREGWRERVEICFGYQC